MKTKTNPDHTTSIKGAAHQQNPSHNRGHAAFTDNRPENQTQQAVRQMMYKNPEINFNPNEPVAQLSWKGAVLGGIGGGLFGYYRDGFWGGVKGLVTGAIGGHLAEEAYNRMNARRNPQAQQQNQQQQQQQQAPPHVFQEPIDRGNFSDNVTTRDAFNQEMEQYVNTGNQMNQGVLSVSNQHLATTANRLDQREQAQRGYVTQELASMAQGNQAVLYDQTITNHQAKNALWEQMQGVVDQGTNSQGAMHNNVKVKVKTSLAQIIATAGGHDLMRQVDALSTQLGIPIRYVEDDQASGYNLKAKPQRNMNGDLVGLTVKVPSDNRYNEAQAFKRVSGQTQQGNTDLRTLGNRVSPSPIDTDMFHEFSHALHYLLIEERRQNAVQGHGQDIPHYDTGLGGPGGLRGQDEVSEARTIHRNNSFADLGQIMGGLSTQAQDPFDDAQTAIQHISGFTQQVPAENDYRHELGLSPRQDHKALTLANGAYSIASQDPIHTH